MTKYYTLYFEKNNIIFKNNVRFVDVNNLFFTTFDLTSFLRTPTHYLVVF